MDFGLFRSPSNKLEKNTDILPLPARFWIPWLRSHQPIFLLTVCGYYHNFRPHKGIIRQRIDLSQLSSLPKKVSPHLILNNSSLIIWFFYVAPIRTAPELHKCCINSLLEAFLYNLPYFYTKSFQITYICIILCESAALPMKKLLNQSLEEHKSSL